MVNKIAIIGISGSGKSTLARKLGEKIDLPVFHMDPLFWRGNWEAVPEAETLARHAELVKKDRWIIEGWLDEKMKDRLVLADQIIYLDYPGYFCVWRLIKRYFKYRKESRPELPKEATEEFLPKHWWMVFNRGERKDIEAALKQADPAKLITVHSPAELRLTGLV